MVKSSNKKKTATKLGKASSKAKSAVSDKNKIEIVEQNEEDGGDEMVIDIEMADEEDGDDISGTSDDEDEDMEDASDASTSTSASSEDAGGADSSSKKTSGSTDGTSGIPIPFLDTFYALSAENANERAAAAHCLIRHCFPGDDAPVQTKDAAYALRRLLAGLCSGRAGARQGYASALSSFLRIAFASTSSDADDLPIYLIQKELAKTVQDNDDDDSMDSDDGGIHASQGGDEHPAEFVRKLLLVQTTPQSVRGQKAAKKGSEERDYIFGRLFGIMAVVRSGTLLGADIPAEVVAEYARSLVKLYKHKSWMRESAAHALMELLTTLQSTGPSKTAKSGFAKIVENIINPSIILNGADGGESIWSDAAKSLTAEQIGLALHIQTLASASGSTEELPLPLSTPLLTPELIPTLANTLRDTSSEVQEQRCHLVWNAIWMYLTEIGQSEGNKKKGSSSRASYLSQRRTLRSTLPVGDDSGEETIKSIIEEIIVNGLLGAGSGIGKGNTTHDRRKLALMLIQSLCGASNPRIELPADIIETSLLQPAVVERAFVNIVQTSSGGRSSQAEHILKPMALQILNSIVDSVVSVPADESERNAELRLAITKSLIRAEPRFDGITKTDTITSLLLVNAGGGATDLITDYSGFLESIIYASKPYDAIGYVNSLVALGKKSLRIPLSGDEDDANSGATLALARHLLAFLLSGAFFDLSSFREPKAKKKKGKKSSKSTKSAEDHPALDVAQRIITACNDATEDGTGLPYQLRTAMASSFFSYLSDAMSMVPSLGNDGGMTKSEKSRKAHDIINFIIHECDALEANGATFYSNIRGSAVEDDVEGENDTSMSPKDALQSMGKLIATIPSDDKAASDAAIGCSSLLSSVYLQLLSPGKPERESFSDEEGHNDMGDDEHQEEMEEINDEAREMISDVLEITGSLLNRDNDDDDNDDDENPLASFAELCVNILSSSIGSGTGKEMSRGSAAKLLRDSVKNAWNSVLSYAQEEEIPFEQDVMSVLVEAVCGSDAMRDEAEAQGGDNDMDSSDDESDSSDDEGVFTAANVADLDLEDGDDSSKEDESDDDDDDDDDDEDEDIELDKDQLNNILMEDSDEDPEDILEHHAGADKALAKLIKLKQEARKAGQAALERVDIANRMRCVMLLEAALSHPSLLEDSAILMAILPILRTRRTTDKEVTSAKTGSNKDARLSEKKSLADRLSGMLQKKICKVRLAGVSDLSGEELSNACAARSELAAHILREAKRSPSTTHGDCCSLSLVLTMKSLPQDEVGAVAVARDVYSEALQEWSEKKTTKLKSSLFDVFIVRSPSLARIVLAEPLANAAKNARSAYLKAESFRLLAELYHVSRSDELPLSATGVTSLEESASSAVTSLCDAMQDDDMTTTKRLRDPLKAAAELVAFGNLHCQSDNAIWDELRKLSKLLNSIGSNSKSQGVKKQCQSLVKKISEGSAAKDGSKKEKTRGSTKKKKAKKNK